MWDGLVLFLHSAVNPIPEKFFYDIGTIICPKLIITILGKPAINIFFAVIFPELFNGVRICKFGERNRTMSVLIGN